VVTPALALAACQVSDRIYEQRSTASGDAGAGGSSLEPASTSEADGGSNDAPGEGTGGRSTGDGGRDSTPSGKGGAPEAAGGAGGEPITLAGGAAGAPEDGGGGEPPVVIDPSCAEGVWDRGNWDEVCWR